jgi:hypothetical protein
MFPSIRDPLLRIEGAVNLGFSNILITGKAIRGEHRPSKAIMKSKIYKLGYTWILWIPGVAVYRFTNWRSAIDYALRPEHAIAA